MKRILHLASILRKSGSGGNSVGGEKQKSKVYLYILGILACIGLVYLAVKADTLLIVLGDASGFIKLLFFIAAIMCVFFSLPAVLSSLYLSDDLQVLLSLPYRPMEILTAKVINVTGLIWGISFIFTVPFTVTYGILHGAGFAFYIAIILALVCIPIIVISFIGIVVMVIMYFMKALRNKDAINIVMAVLMFAFMVVMMILFSKGSESQEQMAEMLATVSVISNILPINYALGMILTEAAWVFIPIVLLITAGFFGVFCFLATKIYISGALAVQETSSSKGQLTEEGLKEACRPKTLFRTYLMKELKHVRREPAYLMQGFLNTILYPGLLLILYVFVGKGMPLLNLSGLTDSAAVLGWMTYISLMVSFVCTSQNIIGSSCMSREGESIMILKQTPVDYKVVLRSKLYSALFISSLGSTTYVVLGGIVLAILGYIPVWAILYGLVINIGTLLFAVSIRMMGDIKRPSFTWESEAQMLKERNGASSIIFLIIGIILPLILMIGIRMFASRSSTNFYIAMAAMIVIVALIAVIETRHLFKAGLAKMKRY